MIKTKSKKDLMEKMKGEIFMKSILGTSIAFGSLMLYEGSLETFGSKETYGAYSLMNNNFRNYGHKDLSQQNIEGRVLGFGGLVFLTVGGLGAYNFLKKTKLFGDEIIIDKIGNAGEVYLMPSLEKPVTLGMNLFMLRFNSNYDPIFVYVFLICKYGRALVYQRITGTVPTSIDKDSVRGILIPRPSEEVIKKVNSVIQDYFQGLKDSTNFYQQAADLLLKELGLGDFRPGEDLWSVVNFS